MQKSVIEFRRCGTAFKCSVCEGRVVMGDLFARVMVVLRSGMPWEERVCLSCGHDIQNEYHSRLGGKKVLKSKGNAGKVQGCDVPLEGKET